jgi:hypothetical protein
MEMEIAIQRQAKGFKTTGFNLRPATITIWVATILA